MLIMVIMGKLGGPMGAMKNIIISIILLQSASVFAALPAEVKSLMNKPGLYVDFVNGFESKDSGQVCRIANSMKGGPESIVIDVANVAEPVIAHLKDAKYSVAGNGYSVYTLNDNGKDSVTCSDSVPLIFYKKTVEIKDNVLVIRRKFKCGLYSKLNEELTVCDIRTQ